MESASQNFLVPKASPASNRYITHPSLHIRNAQDALILFEAVRLNILPLITRRLNGNERSQLKSGDIFVWEESENKGALSRWTDGRRWSQSRMRGDYLWYQEQIDISQEERDAKAARRALKTLDPTSSPSTVSRRQDRPAKPGGLIKQTYSTMVRHTSSWKKWHIVAYFSEDEYLRLPTVDHYEYLRRLRVPDGIFLPGKASTRKLDQPNTPSLEGSSRPMSPSESSSSEVYSRDRDQFTWSTRSSTSSPSGTDNDRVHALPPLSLLTPSGSSASSSSWSTRADTSKTRGDYLPRSSEDRKAIESFRLAL